MNLSGTDSMNHQNSSYKFKSSNGVGSVNNHLPGGVTGGGNYRQQRSGPHPLQQQPLNLSHVCETMLFIAGYFGFVPFSFLRDGCEDCFISAKCSVTMNLEPGGLA